MPVTLVTVSGISPAILTETIWALAQETPAVTPDEVIVITTTRGEADLRRQLLTPLETWGGRTVWQQLRLDVLPATRLTRKKGSSASPPAPGPLQLSIRVIDLPDPDTGVRRPADDLRTRAHHDETANFIIQTLAPLCDAEDHHVIASIAGGRKTMGALLYAAMSLLGKETDRVTHVLVSDPYDTIRGFYYPGQPVDQLSRPTAPATSLPAILDTTAPLSARDAIVELADIPFVPLRNKFHELNEPRRTFAGLVERYSRAERPGSALPPRLALDLPTGTLTVDGRPLSLTGRDLLVTAFLLHRALEKQPHFRDRGEAHPHLLLFQTQWKKDHPFHQATARLSGKLSDEDITKALAGLRKKLTAAGLATAIPHLAPERRRIGFDITHSQD